MKKDEAIKNLKIMAWLFLIVGIMAMFSAVYYLGETNNILDSIFDLVFGLCMLYFSYLIWSSAKSLN